MNSKSYHKIRNCTLLTVLILIVLFSAYLYTNRARNNQVNGLITDKNNNQKLESLKNVNKTQGSNVATFTIKIPYGNEKESVGAYNRGEGAMKAPNSFAVDNQGNIYITDTVNNRIQKFASDGKYITSLPIDRDSPTDIYIDKSDRMYVYGEHGKLYQYDSKGGLLSSIEINENQWDSRGPMHIVDNNIYIRGSGKGDVLIAKIEGDSLLSPSEAEMAQPLVNGTYGLSGKIYLPVLDFDTGEAIINILDKNSSTKITRLPFNHILSTGFIGEDNSGNSYFETETDDNGNIFVEVSKLNSKGDYIDTVSIPKADYEFSTIKMTSVDGAGVMYHMSAGRNQITMDVISFR